MFLNTQIHYKQMVSLLFGVFVCFSTNNINPVQALVFFTVHQFVSERVESGVF